MEYCKNAFIIIDKEDGEIYINTFKKGEEDLMMRKVSKYFAFDDVDDTFMVGCIIYQGREVSYAGWMPDNTMQYYYRDSNELAWEGCFPEWCH